MIRRFLLFVPLYFRLNFCLIEEIYPLKQCFQTVFHINELSVTRLTGIDFVIANDIFMPREYFLLIVGLFKRGCWMPSCPPSNWIWQNCPKSCIDLKTHWSANKPATQIHQSSEFWTYVECQEYEMHSFYLVLYLNLPNFRLNSFPLIIFEAAFEAIFIEAVNIHRITNSKRILNSWFRLTTFWMNLSWKNAIGIGKMSPWRCFAKFRQAMYLEQEGASWKESFYTWRHRVMQSTIQSCPHVYLSLAWASGVQF